MPFHTSIIIRHPPSLNGAFLNPATGEVKKIFIGNRRLKTIFNTNMRVAYNQSRARAQYALEGDILLRYVAILDHRTRDSHKKMHGTLLSRWHNFWKLNYPPNGWNCRCRVNAYTRAEAKAKGWEETEDEFLPQGGIADKDWRYDTRNLTGEWAELDRVYLDKANRIIQGAHPSIKDHIQKGLREIEGERRTYGELKGACEEMGVAYEKERERLGLKGKKREKIPFPATLPKKNIELCEASEGLCDFLLGTLPLKEREKLGKLKVILSHETIFTHLYHEDIEAIDYFMVRFHDRAYHMEKGVDHKKKTESPYHAIYYYKEGYFYKAVFKVTKNYKEIYLLSLIKSESGENFKPEAYQKHKSRKR